MMLHPKKIILRSVSKILFFEGPFKLSSILKEHLHQLSLSIQLSRLLSFWDALLPEECEMTPVLDAARLLSWLRESCRVALDGPQVFWRPPQPGDSGTKRSIDPPVESTAERKSPLSVSAAHNIRLVCIGQSKNKTT